MNHVKRIVVLGPYDRYNYGDLLFPFMLSYAFERMAPGQYNFSYYALIAAKLSTHPPISVNDYNAYRQQIRNEKPSGIIIAGGEVLNATWHVLYSFINNKYYQLIQNKWGRRILQKLSIARLILGGKNEFPFVIGHEIGVEIPIFYNAVGGVHADVTKISKNLESAALLGVRDVVTLTRVNAQHIPVLLMPDSAIIISDVYRDKEWNKYCEKSVIKSLENTPFILFQISQRYAEGYWDVCESQLQEIAQKYSCKIVLCTFSNIHGARNDIPLRALKERNDDFLYVDDLSIYTTTWLIKHAQCYIGSSLHGVIVSMSFATPYIAIGKENEKVQAFLDSWSIDALQLVIVPDQILKRFQVLNFYTIRAEMEIKAQLMKDHYYDAVRKMDLIMKSK